MAPKQNKCSACRKEVDESLMATSTLCERCYEYIQESDEKYKTDDELVEMED